MMFGNYNAYQPVGTPQQFAMDQMQQFQQALRGVVRYPNTFAYNAGPSPFCGNGCCCCCCGTANI